MRRNVSPQRRENERERPLNGWCTPITTIILDDSCFILCGASFEIKPFIILYYYINVYSSNHMASHAGNKWVINSDVK